ncbi:unnamed protein product [Acanthoscelides obtectus]|uniref:C-type lectin domain-containing protein n=1 Tax=Acanthoscelides obtectus TaxID=200917 RepID=A0A9P0LDT0_ACAOB|nr:unnamed protein product [Acanthoscelides obtectus]CAK1669538.1 hypothetical protein AOBTE_LOCUS27060 [Acanthoscelides obtectus]
MKMWDRLAFHAILSAHLLVAIALAIPPYPSTTVRPNTTSAIPNTTPATPNTTPATPNTTPATPNTTPATPNTTPATTSTTPTPTPTPSTNAEDLPVYCSSGIGYYVERIMKADYFQAFFFCKYHGLELLSVTSRDMEKSLVDAFSNLDIADDTYFLTSAKSLDTISSSNKNEWVWMSSGKYMKYTNWQTTNDVWSSSRVRDDSNSCVKIFYDSRKISWVQTSCSELNHFVCQTGPLSGDPCRDKWGSKSFYPQVIME